jgi:anti-sigma regulatory factor (Ser/Thr protein kinase)
VKKVFELPARSDVLRGLRGELRLLLEQGGWQKKHLDEIVLAVDEALTNVIRHAYGESGGTMKISFEDSPDRTEIEIEDHGKKFDPTQAPMPELPRHRPGGLGIHFIRTIMDELIYDRAFTEGNRLRMIKRKTKISKREGVA